MKYLVLIIPILVGCHTKSLDYYNFTSWEGNWQSSDSSGTFIENWERINDTLCQGKGMMIVKGDTLFSEKIKLVFNKNNVRYVVVAEGQNKGSEVPFTLTNFSKDTWVFENPNHDFPKRIKYFSPTADSLIATVEGMEDTVPRSFVLRFKRN